MDTESKKVALVFGGQGYVGSAITETLRDAGWIVITAGRSTESDQFHIPSDIIDPYSVQSVIDTLFSRYGRLDAVIHASSPKLERVSIEKSNPELSELHMKVAVDGTANLAAACLHRMAEGGAFIVITSSVVKDDGKELKMGSYPLAKRKQHELIAQIAKKNKYKVRVFEIMPGFLPGGLNEDLPTSIRENFAKKSDGTVVGPDSVTKIVSKICENSPIYIVSSGIDTTSGTITSF